MKQAVLIFFMVLAICVNHILVVSGQYNNNNGFQPVSEQQNIDTVTEYEYYDEYEDSSMSLAQRINPFKY